jgi:chromatin remodeling complex protein RSC6
MSLVISNTFLPKLPEAEVDMQTHDDAAMLEEHHKIQNAYSDKEEENEDTEGQEGDKEDDNEEMENIQPPLDGKCHIALTLLYFMARSVQLLPAVTAL